MAKLDMNQATLLAAALEGLEIQRSRIEEQIAQIKAAMGRGGSKKTASAAGARPGRKRRLSAAARARIAAAQKKRWAEYRKAKAAG